MLSAHAFPAKILLFGEYALTVGAHGLSMPYILHKGMLTLDNTQSDARSNHELQDYVTFLQQQKNDTLDMDAFARDVRDGMFFASDIPQGFGIGSSAALVASVYDHYALDKITLDMPCPQKMAELKNIFMNMEDYFHGKSSGLDPLVSYVNAPLLLQGKDRVEPVELPCDPDGKSAIFLLNSNEMSKTSQMIGIFRDQMACDDFRQNMHDDFMQYNDRCIDGFLRHDMQEFFSDLKQLSSWSLNHFAPMISSSMIKPWQDGLESDAYYLKLCGSGGGGYAVGFAPDYQKAEDVLASYQPKLVCRF